MYKTKQKSLSESKSLSFQRNNTNSAELELERFYLDQKLKSKLNGKRNGLNHLDASVARRYFY